MTHEARLRFRLWLANHAPALGGVALVAIGSTGSAVALTLGWGTLGILFFAWVFHAEGFHVARPARASIRTRWCRERPGTFTLRHRGRVLLLLVPTTRRFR